MLVAAWNTSETQVPFLLLLYFSVQNDHVQVLGAFCHPCREREAHPKEAVWGKPEVALITSAHILLAYW